MIFRPKDKYLDNFTVLPNLLLRGGTDTKRRGDELKPESLGVLVYLLSHKDDWQVQGSQIAKHFGISPNRVTKITQDLERAGYITRIPPTRIKGKLIWDWLVSAEPQDRNSEDLKNKDLNSEDLKNEDVRSNILKEESLVRNNIVEEELFSSPPEHVSEQAWTLWWKHKIKQNRNRKPTQKQINLHTAHFNALVAAGHRDFEGLVKNAINREWQSIGDPDWGSVKAFKKQNDHMDYLGAIR